MLMKRILLLSLLIIQIASDINAQAKRYIFMEHFTNTYCGICGARNPSFYSLLTKYEGNYHHMTVHPSFPYTACTLYQANKTENSLRANYYAINSTPTLVIHGTSKKSLSSVNAAVLDAELNKTSPVQVVVKETGSSLRNISVEIKTVGNKPSGTFRVYAAAVERKINLASPNGEKVHHNVFRKFISQADGDPISLSDNGGSQNLSYSLTIDPSWVESEVYVLVWVQDINTKEVLNSGNKFDITSSTTNPSGGPDFHVLANPVKSNLILQLEKPVKGEYYVLNLMGQLIEKGSLNPYNTNLELGVDHYKKGIYLVRIQSGGLKTTKRWIKD